MSNIQAIGTGISWISDHNPTATEPTISGTVDKYQFLFNTVNGKIFTCTGTDADIETNPNVNLSWKQIGVFDSNFDISSLQSLTPYSNEMAQDAVGSIMSGSNGINVNYNDAGNAIVISGITPTTNDNVARTLDSNYTIASNVRGAICSYSISVSWALSALLSGSAAVFLEYSTNNGSSWITVNNVGKTLALLTFAGSDDMNICGFIPSNATHTRIRTTSTRMTITYTRGQEVLL